MAKGLIFFCCACCILLLTIINLSIGPIINRKITNYGTRSCAYQKDLYDKAKEGTLTDAQKKYTYEWVINQCERRKAMGNMEYTSFIFDIAIGFVCGLLGLLHLFDLKKDFVSTTGLIGLGCGVVGFVLSFVYVILNGLVYTNYYDSGIYKRDGNGAFAELEGNKYKCFYFDDDVLNTYSYFAKFSDLNKKQYNYNKGFEEDLSKIDGLCRMSPNVCIGTQNYLEGFAPIKDSKNNDCKFLYIDDSSIQEGIENKDIADRFLTALILSLFVCLANIGLALFGFLLFRAPSDF